MSPDKIHNYRQRWRDLERRQRDLDFARSQWAKDLRGEFPAGAAGDTSFVKWCAQTIGLNAAGAQELLSRAAAIELVPTEVDWKTYGGFNEIKHVLPLNKSTRTRVLDAAKATDQSIRSAVRSLAPQAAAKPTISAKDDAARLAAYLVSKKVPLTSSIQEIVYRYVARQTVRDRHLQNVA